MPWYPGSRPRPQRVAAELGYHGRYSSWCVRQTEIYWHDLDQAKGFCLESLSNILFPFLNHKSYSPRKLTCPPKRKTFQKDLFIFQPLIFMKLGSVTHHLLLYLGWTGDVRGPLHSSFLCATTKGLSSPKRVSERSSKDFGMQEKKSASYTSGSQIGGGIQSLCILCIRCHIFIEMKINTKAQCQ